MNQQNEDRSKHNYHQTVHTSRPNAHDKHQQGRSQHNQYYDKQSESQYSGYDEYQARRINGAGASQATSSYDCYASTSIQYGLHHQEPVHSHEHPSGYYEPQNVNSNAPSDAPWSATAAGPRTAWRSETLDSSASGSTAALAYARSVDSDYSHRSGQKPNISSKSSGSVPVPQIRVADRATVYDDDYEELTHELTGGTMPRPPSLASATLGDASTDTSFTIVRATVLEPDLPKAKCADCGEKLDFDELANHSCHPAGASRSPLLTIQVPVSSSTSTLSSTATSPPVTTPRSPFFERYDDLTTDVGPMSSAHLGKATTTDDMLVRDEDDVTPKAHAVRVIGPQAAIKVSHITASSRADTTESGLPPLRAPPMQRSASDTTAADAATDRRKMIEQQRAAKRKKDMMAVHLPRAATTSSMSKQSTSPDERVKTASQRDASITEADVGRRTYTKPTPEGQHVKTGSSSSLSSTGTASSERMGLTHKHLLLSKANGGGSSTASITPSSSYEHIEDGAHKHYNVGKKVSTDCAPSKPVRERGHVDLSCIEEMMKGLTVSPEPLERSLSDVPRKPGYTGSQRRRSTTEADKTERERALEQELERWRDKERTRQLQAMRLKEKRRKERLAKRCCICDCSLSSSRTPFVERDGKFLCARDWKELYLPKCRKCKLSVERGAVKSSDGALRGVFHRSCFSCAACEAPFTDGSFYVFNNQPYCSRHYHQLNGSLCRECESGIEGECRQTDTGDRFHPHCFSCQYTSKHGSCLEPLADYYLVGGQRLCERHADKVGRRLAKAGQKHLDLRTQKRMTMLHSLR